MNGKSSILIAAIAGVAAATGAYLATNGGSKAFHATATNDASTMTVSFDGVNALTEVTRVNEDGVTVVEFNNGSTHSVYTMEADGSYKLADCMDIKEAASLFGQASWMFEDNMVRINHMGQDYTVELDENNQPVSLNSRQLKMAVTDFGMGAQANFKTGAVDCNSAEARNLASRSVLNSTERDLAHSLQEEGNKGKIGNGPEENSDLDKFNSNNWMWGTDSNGQTGRTDESCYTAKVQDAIAASYCGGPITLQNLHSDYVCGSGKDDYFHYLSHNSGFYSANGRNWSRFENPVWVYWLENNEDPTEEGHTQSAINAIVAGTSRTNCGHSPNNARSCRLFIAGNNQGVTAMGSADRDVMVFCLRENNSSYWAFIGFAGSNDGDDWANNANGGPVWNSALSLNCHGGFVTEFKNMVGDGSEYWDADRVGYARARHHRFHIGGHSLGGSLAQIVGRYLNEHADNFVAVKVSTGGSPKPWWGTSPQDDASRHFRTAQRNTTTNDAGDSVPCLGAIKAIGRYTGTYKAFRDDGYSQDKVALLRIYKRWDWSNYKKYYWQTGNYWFGGNRSRSGLSYNVNNELRVLTSWLPIYGWSYEGLPNLSRCAGILAHVSAFYANHVPKAACHSSSSAGAMHGNTDFISGSGRSTLFGMDQRSIPIGGNCPQLYLGTCRSSNSGNYYCVQGTRSFGTCASNNYCCRYAGGYGF